VRIAVCVKQVPETAGISIDPATHTLVRSGAAGVMNPYDRYALEMAHRLAGNGTGVIRAVSMGPAQAESTLRECLSLGASAAYLVSDQAFAGSDTLATSYILSEAIRKIERLEGVFDVVFCGKQSIDGDTAQVGPEIAEYLGVPHVVCAVDVRMEGSYVTAKRETWSGYEILKVPTPCLITVTKPPFEPRLPTLSGRLAAKRAEIHRLDAPQIGLDPSLTGLRGSPTRVVKTYKPPARGEAVILSGQTAADAADAAKRLADILFRLKVPREER
jgi:electron transfer flavoprotein beta subunit